MENVVSLYIINQRRIPNSITYTSVNRLLSDILSPNCIKELIIGSLDIE